MDICQFYVILGDQKLVPKDDFNVYINATSVEDIRLIWKAIEVSYQKKSKEGKKVGREIIFLISDVLYEARAKEIIDKLHINGKIQLFSNEEVKKEEVGSEVVDTLESEVKPRVDVQSNINNRVGESGISNSTLNESIDTHTTLENSTMLEKKEVSPYTYRPSNVYHGDQDVPVTGGGNARVGGSFGQGGAIYKSNSSVKTLTKRKSSAFVSLPVIIFIISALLLIVSFVLLFVLG